MSIIKKGMEMALASSGKAGKFLTLKADQPVDVVLAHGLDGVQSVEQHDWWDYNPAPHLVCLGDDCPSCALGNEARTKSYIGVITKEQEVKYLPAGISILSQLQKFEKAVGDLTGKLVRFEKNGVGLKTKYSAIMLGKKLDVSKFVLPDLEELLGAVTVEAQVAALEAAGVDVSSLSRRAPAKAGKKAKPVDAPVEKKEELDFSAEDDTAETDGWATL